MILTQMARIWLMNDLLLIHRVVLTHASYRIFLLATTVLGSLIGARHHRSVSCRVCWKIRNWIESTTSHVITSHWTIIYYICLGVSFMFNGYKLIICTRGWSEYLNIYLIIFLVFFRMFYSRCPPSRCTGPGASWTYTSFSRDTRGATARLAASSAIGASTQCSY